MAKRPDMALLKVDIVSWDSQVARQFSLRSIPFMQVYDKNGTLIASGNEARTWLQRNQ